ncbi:MAG: hypothetical protein R3C46_11065 [Hyphomonadaceae bacterium]
MFDPGAGEGRQMSDGAAGPIAADRPGWAGQLLAAVRFLATDRFGLLALIWALIAFAMRPAFLAAHDGATGWPFEAIRGAMDPVALAHAASVIQWAAFAGLLALAVIGHMRFAAAHPGALDGDGSRFRIGAAYALLLMAGYLAFLWSPASVFTVITHDSLIFFDSTYRISNGLVPSSDFPTALGAAQLYLPAWAAWLIGGYGGSVELASVWVALGLGLACAVVGAWRFPVGMTAVLLGIVFLVTVPAAMLERWGGESQTLINGETEILPDNLSWAMFYNRWGWATLFPLFMALAPRRDPEASPGIAEIAVLSAVLAFMFWLKVSYFAVGLGAAAVYAFLNPAPWRTLALGAGMTAGGILAIGLMTGNLLAYLNDILLAGKVSGARTESLLGLIRRNLLEMLFALAPLGVLAVIRRFTWKDGVVAGFMLAASMFAINQNGQLENMTSLVVLAAYGAVRVFAEADAQRVARVAAVGAFAMLAASQVLDRGMVLIDHAYAILREEAREPAEWAALPAFRNVYVPERESMFNRAINKSETPEERIHNIWLSGQYGRRQELRQGEYMETLLAGVEDLKRVVRRGETVNTLDMTNPFPFLMNLRAPKGGWLTLHMNRTISEDVHPAPEVMFADSDHVMIAKMSMVQSTADLMKQVYGDWLDANYGERVETLYWTRWSHRKPALRPATQLP